MFYLINEKDGLSGSGILVNALNLNNLYVQSGGKNLEVVFNHTKKSDNSFEYSFAEIFDVNQVIKNISQLTKVEYSNNFIVLTDIENIENINKNFKNKSYLHNKITTILMNINEIEVVYEHNGRYLLGTAYKNFTIKESPSEVLDLIENKIVHNLTTNSVENKLQIKHRL